MNPLLGAALAAVTSLVAPSRCAACDASTRLATAFCPTCARTLVRASSHDPERLAALVYGGAMADAIRRFKFDDRPDLASPLAAAFVRLIPTLSARSFDVVVPVPLHPQRLVERGYNQAALLGRRVGRMLDIRSVPRLLERRTPTSRQTDLSREERAINVANAFAVVEARVAHGKRVLLVDDVETTGATLAACRTALTGAGAKVVVTLVLARAEVGAPAVIRGESRT